MARTYGDDAARQRTPVYEPDDRWDDGPVVLGADPWDDEPTYDAPLDHRWDDLRGEWRDEPRDNGPEADLDTDRDTAARKTPADPAQALYRQAATRQAATRAATQAAARTGSRPTADGPGSDRDERPSWLVTPMNDRRVPRPDIDRFMPAPARPSSGTSASGRPSSGRPGSGQPTTAPAQRRPAGQGWPRQNWSEHDGPEHDGPEQDGPEHDGPEQDGQQKPGPHPPRTTAARGGTDVDVTSSDDRPPAEATAGNRLFTVMLFFAGLAASVAMWLFDTQPGAINSTATLLTAAGRITGLIAGYLLFIQLLMMSRVSWLEEWVGARDLLRWHRWLGTSLLAFVVAHIVFIVYGYALTARTDAVSQAWSMVTTFEDMLSATVATGLLVFISLLALRIVRRVMPYELWHLLHLTGYAVLLLGYGHQVAVGADLSGRFASVWWPGLGALVVAALVWGRVVEPLYLNLRHRLEVADVVAESDEAFSIYLTGRNLDKLPAQAGQFLRWRFLNANGWWQSHPFSLSAAPNDKWLRLTVTVVGRHTSRLEELQAGTKVWAEGPFGTFTAERRTRRKALLIAGGSGIAPIRALLEDMPADTVVVYRARTTDDLVFREELDALARRRRSIVRYVVGGREDPGPRRLFTADGMQTMVPDVHRRDIYLCGSPGLVDTAVATMRELDVPTSQLHLDPFEF